jgi:hypothetical protein
MPNWWASAKATRIPAPASSVKICQDTVDSPTSAGPMIHKTGTRPLSRTCRQYAANGPRAGARHDDGSDGHDPRQNPPSGQNELAQERQRWSSRMVLRGARTGSALAGNASSGRQWPGRRLPTATRGARSSSPYCCSRRRSERVVLRSRRRRIATHPDRAYSARTALGATPVSRAVIRCAHPVPVGIGGSARVER